MSVIKQKNIVYNALLSFAQLKKNEKKANYKSCESFENIIRTIRPLFGINASAEHVISRLQS